jgi:hypothetical protein
MKRAFWTLGMGIVGFWLPWSVSYLPGSSISDIAVGTLWGASIGLGFGTIFEQKQLRKRIIFYWAATMALVGTFFGLLILNQFSSFVAGGAGALTGTLLGTLFGIMHLSLFRRRSKISRSNVLA